MSAPSTEPRAPSALRVASVTAALLLSVVAGGCAALDDPEEPAQGARTPRATATSALDPADTPWIAFVSRQAGVPQVQFVRSDGTGLTDYDAPLRSPPDVFEESPAWSADGTQLALIVTSSARVALRVLDFAGGAWRDVPHGLAQITGPAWSADGTQLVVEGRAAGDTSNRLYVIDLPDGGDCSGAVGCRALTSPPSPGADSSPVWASDGMVYFVRRDADEREVYSIAGNGNGTATALTSGSEVVGGLALSADETLLLYTRLEAAAADTVVVAHTLVGGAEATLGSAGDGDFVPLGDGLRAVLVRKTLDDDSELALVDAATGNLTLQLTSDAVGNSAPAVSPVDSAGIDVTAADCEGDEVSCSPGHAQCPSVSPYTGVVFGIRPGLAPGQLVPWCSSEGEVGDLIVNYRIELVDEATSDRTTLFEIARPAGTALISGAGVVCTQPTYCTGGRLDSDALAGGDWTLEYQIELQTTGLVVDSFPFTRLDLSETLARLEQALQLVRDAVDGLGNLLLAADIDDTRALLAHAAAALAQGQDTTVFAAMTDVNDEVLSHRDDLDVAGAYKNLLNVLLTEYNDSASRFVDQGFFGGTAALDLTEAGSAWAEAVAARDASASGNASSALRRAIFHRARLTDALMPAFEEGIAGSAAVPSRGDTVALYGDLEGDAQALLAAIQAESAMFGEVELSAATDLLAAFLPDLEQYAIDDSVMSNESIALMVEAQFRLLPLLEVAAARHLGLFALRQRAIYGLYAIVQASIPSASLNIDGGDEHPLIVEAYRRFDAMGERIEAYLDPGSPDHLQSSALVDLVLMASAGPGDWATLGGSSHPSPGNGLETLTNACFINAVLISAYVPSGRVGPGGTTFATDSFEYFPETPIVIFDGCDEATLAGVTDWR